MKSRYVSRTPHNRRLIIIFAGWGMDSRPFRDLHAQGYDILIVWDYRNLTFNWTPLMRYEEICLIAWSMGVFAASLTIHEIDPRITKRIAVCGTLDPISDRRGIPTATYHGTINALTPGSLHKFYRRMCSDTKQFEQFREHRPQRPLAELIDELNAIETHTIFHTPQVDNWDLAIIGRNDRIFPVANQLSAWRQTAPTKIEDCGHLPDFQKIIDSHIIDKTHVQQRFTQATDTYSQAAQAQQKIARTLLDLFARATGNDSIPQLNGDILEIGCGQGTLTNLYARHLSPNAQLRLWDIASVDTSAMPTQAIFTQCDAETAIRRLPPRSLAYILSSSTIQWFNSPAAFLRQCERTLIPGGYLIISTFAAGNLGEITQTTNTSLNLPTQAQWQNMISDKFTLYVCQASTLTLKFPSPAHVLRHLRDTGVNALSTNNPRITMARSILNNHPRDTEGNCPLTYRPIFIIARRNDPTERN